MLRIDTAQQLALIEPERDAVIGLPRARFPRGFLTGQHDRQAIEVGDEAAIDGLVEHVQPCLVCQELADGDSLFALLRELRPVRAHPFLVVEPAAGVGDRQRHRGQPLGGRVDDDHGVLLPRLAGLLVSDAAPEVNDLLAAMIGTAGAAQLPAASEVLEQTPRARRQNAGRPRLEWTGKERQHDLLREPVGSALNPTPTASSSASSDVRGLQIRKLRLDRAVDLRRRQSLIAPSTAPAVGVSSAVTEKSAMACLSSSTTTRRTRPSRMRPRSRSTD